MHDEIQDEFPLTSMQQSLLLASLTSRGRDPYIESAIGEFNEPLDARRVALAWQHVVDAFDVLRTSFHRTGDEAQPVQRVHQHVVAEMLELDWRDADADEQAERMRKYVEQQVSERFDFEQPQLVRFSLIRLGDEAFRIVWVFHHLIMDGRSTARVLDTILSTYRRLRDSEPPQIDAGPPFREHADWLSKRDFSASHSYWQEQFDGFEPHRLSLPRQSTLGISDNLEASEHFHSEWTSLTIDQTKRLGEIATSLRMTSTMFVQGAWALVLGQMANRCDVAFGVTRAGRKSVANSNSIVGLLITATPLRIRWDDEEKVSDWLTGIRGQWFGLRRHEHTPSTAIREAIGLPSGETLMKTIVSLESARLDDFLRSVAGKRMNIRTDLVSDHEVAVYAYGGERLALNIVVHPQSGDASTPRLLVERVKSAILALVNHFDGTLGDVVAQITPESEMQLLAASNSTRRQHASDALVHEMFESVAEQHPDSTAVVACDRTLTYRQLNERSNQLGRVLQDRGVTPGDTVGLFCERNSDLVTAMLAVLKCGACFVPLDPSQPSQRLASMLGDSDASFLITQQASISKTPVTGATIFVIEQQAEVIEKKESHNLNIEAASDSLAYTMYTSGSTGRPKGVDVSHRALVNLLEDAAITPGLSTDDCVIAATTVLFDPAILQLFLPLVVGAQLVVANEAAVFGGDDLARCIDQHHGTYLMTTPVILRSLRDANWQGQAGLCVSYIGEPLSPDVAAWILPLVGELWNTYGPTEATVYCTTQQIVTAGDVAYIGRPIGNTTAYVLDGALRAVPAGVIGELFIGGECLARGYRNDADMTVDRFVEHPLATNCGGRFYRTGDLARWTTDGVLEYLGREDSQVKVHGVRIELSEIQTALEKHAAVSQAVVLVEEMEDGSKQLAGCIVPVESRDAKQQVELRDELRRHLLAMLPTSMHPRSISFIDDLPQTPNGKLDRRALPLASRSDRDAATERVAPRTPTEQALAAIVAKLMPHEQIGVECNLLEAGIDSLLVFQAVNKAKSAGLTLSPRDFFEQPTIALLAAHVDQQRQEEPATA